MKLRWERITDCTRTRDAFHVVYVWARNGHVRYVGKAKNFGGAGGRYAFGYQYLARLLLEGGFRLYISKSLTPAQWRRINDIEGTLMERLDSAKLENKRHPKIRQQIALDFDRPWRRK
jgi:hypothetical protein